VIGPPLDFSGTDRSRAGLIAVSDACEQAVRALNPAQREGSPE